MGALNSHLPSRVKLLTNLYSRKPHERMIANVESMEVLLQVSFGRGIKHLSTPPTDPDHERLLQAGEKLCVASLKTFLVSCTNHLDVSWR